MGYLMPYLTFQHTPAPSHITLNGKRWPVQILIARNDRDLLAQGGIYPHVTAEGAAPLGYTDWALIDDEYRREPAGTPEERQAAIEVAAAAAHEAYLDSLECTRLQGKLALIDAGLWDQYEALIASLLPSMTPAQRVFVEDAQVWKYRDPVLQMFAAAIELTEAQTIALFETAKSL
ncbi:hypothetical protein [Thiocapsa sp.]|uniref:hypothetical protein n=1 Tax=Thiocapsa sp. TaxID=2024551 RepID=UPI0025FCB4B4|nr:hypothetical protein [Thiocapsa sp.]